MAEAEVGIESVDRDRNTYRDCLDYIDKYWERITFYLPSDKEGYIGLPNPFVSPNEDLFKNEQFYWDSYFIMLGLLSSGRIELARGMVDNFVHMVDRFGHVPATNKYSVLGISQPPFLSSMGLLIFKKTMDQDWFLKVALAAEKELNGFWMGEGRLAYSGLSRFYGHGTNVSAELDSAWDMTSRFNERALDYLPVDLNSLLYKYETDLALAFKLAGEKKKGKYYKKRANLRARRIKDLMWDKEKSFFFDFNFKQRRIRRFYSVAGFYPLWAGIATKAQAKKVRDSLPVLECPGGIANTQKQRLSKEEFKQHDYPNGWPHQQWIVVKGLLNYGFEEDARRIAFKWLDLNADVFRKTGKFWEKYDVVDLGIGKSGKYYVTQDGFGWSNGVFVKLVDTFLG